MKLSEQQWQQFEETVKKLHTADIPESIISNVPKETFSLKCCQTVRLFLKRIENEVFDEAVAAKLAALLKSKNDIILNLIKRTEELCSILQNQSLQYVLCHSDMHGWNLLIDHHNHLYLIDWDTLILAPKKRDLLLLDEPTNHLDKENRKSLMQMLKKYQGTLIVVSHDTELLRNCIDTLWHIDNNKIHEFTRSYDDYMREIKQKRASIEKELASLKRDKFETHNALMKEQKRAAGSKAKGQKNIEQRKWPTIVSKSKALRAEQTSGKKKSAIDKKKQQLTNQLSDLRLPEIILPKFSLMPKSISSDN